MNKKNSIPFIADYFLENLEAGAELNDSVLISYLEQKGFDIVKIRSKDVTREILDSYDFFIVSNFKRLKPSYREYLAENKKYIIFEHDHKLCKNRKLRKHIDEEYIIKKGKIVNADFYRKAYMNYFLTNLQAMVYQKNLHLDNVKIFHTSFFDRKDLNEINVYAKKYDKVNDCIIIKDYKEYKTCLKYAKKNRIDFTVFDKRNRKEFLKLIAQSKKLVFHTNQVESFCRVVAEAQMMNCEIITGHRAFIGFYSEAFADLYGEELLQELSDYTEHGLQDFYNTITEAKGFNRRPARIPFKGQVRGKKKVVNF